MVASFLQPHDICEWLRMNTYNPEKLRYPELEEALPPLPDNFGYSPDEPGELKKQRLGREPLHLPGGPEPIQRLAWCTGAAQGFIDQAATLGVDAYISGEVSEQTAHQAQELGIHYFAAGHHATERYGVQALGQRLAGEFGIEHRFIEIPNPV